MYKELDCKHNGPLSQIFTEKEKSPDIQFLIWRWHKTVKGQLYTHKEMKGEINTTVKNENTNPVFNSLVSSLPEQSLLGYVSDT